MRTPPAPLLQRLRDVAVVVVALLVAGTWLHGLVTDPFADPVVGGVDLDRVQPVQSAAVVVSLLSCVALWWRRRAPVGLTVAATVVALVTTFDGAAYLALLTLAVRRRDRLLPVLALAVVVASTAAAVRGEHLALPAAVAAAAGTTALCVFLGAYAGARRDLVTSLRERAERAEGEYALRAEQARLAERTRIAREMHDVLAHRISLVALHAGGLEVRPDVGAEQVEATAATIRQTASTALDDLRRVLGVLRGPTAGAAAEPAGPGTGWVAAELAPQPTLVDLRRLVESTREAGVDASFRTDVPLHADVPAELGRTAYRVVQEALTNVHKHAPTARTRVVVSGEVGRDLVVVVVNAAPAGGGPAGRASLPGAGSGLVGLAERVGLADGALTSGPEPDGGFAVRARVPWPAPPGSTRRSASAAWAPPDGRIGPAQQPVTADGPPPTSPRQGRHP